MKKVVKVRLLMVDRTSCEYDHPLIGESSIDDIEDIAGNVLNGLLEHAVATIKTSDNRAMALVTKHIMGIDLTVKEVEDDE
jgi:hypothetical protein